jgi:2-dehydro-3-deoxyphosphogluconate aldolase/(4S)-4-hydroxy-2-oxoglutarate aldolase
VLDGLFVAAGTVLSVGQLEQARVAGAQLALAPGSNFEVIRAARACGLPFVAGAGTASEVEALRRFGVRVVKVFPFRTVGGVEFLRSLAAVYPEMRFVPTGGIDAGNLSDAASAPGVLAVGGSWIAPVELVRAGCFDQIEQNARSARMLLR